MLLREGGTAIGAASSTREEEKSIISRSLGWETDQQRRPNPFGEQAGQLTGNHAST